MDCGTDGARRRLEGFCHAERLEGYNSHLYCKGIREKPHLSLSVSMDR